MILVTKFYRGKVVESFDLGYGVVVNEKNEVIFTAGDPHYPIYIRSAAKPFQAVPIIEKEADKIYKLSEEDLAVICASHSGETIHTERVSGILKKIGLGVESLKCGVHTPLDKSAYEQLILKGGRPTVLHNNCSGKHAGMLAVAKAMDTTIDDYLALNHPVQKLILEKIKEYAEKDKVLTAADDCNAPTFFLPMQNLAIMYRKLAQETDDALNKIFHAMTLRPKMIAGRNRFDTDFTAALSGKGLSKIGSQGVRAIGLRTGAGQHIGLVVKVLSGNKAASSSMAMKILGHLKLLDEKILAKLSHYANPELKNYVGRKTGKVESEITIEGSK